MSAGPSPKTFEMTNNEFISAICRRNAVDDATTPEYTPLISRENPQLFSCACDGNARPEAIDCVHENATDFEKFRALLSKKANIRM